MSRCYYCGGNHSAEFCPGYHARGLRNDVSELQGAVDSLATLSDDHLNDVESAIDRMSEAAANDAEAARAMLDSLSTEVSGVGLEIGGLRDVTRDGFTNLSNDVNAGFGAVAGSLGALIGVTFLGFAGVSAMLAYREQNDRVRHNALMSHFRENSLASSAHRALQLGLAYSEMERIDDALTQIKEAIRQYPTWSEVHRVEALVLGKSGDMPGASRSLEMALHLLNRGDQQPTQIVDEKNDHSEEDNEYEERDVPERSDLNRLRRSVVLQFAATLAAIDNSPKAISLLRTELGDRQEHGELWHELGRLLALSGDRESAFDPLVRAVLSTPERYSVIATDPQLGGTRDLVHAVRNEVRARKLRELTLLETAWMSMRGASGIHDLPVIGSDGQYLALHNEVLAFRSRVSNEDKKR